MSDNAHLTPGQASRRAAVSTDTLRRWVREGHLTRIRTATGSYRFRTADIDALIASGAPASRDADGAS